MIAAYLLAGQDCGGRFFDQAPSDEFCKECGVCLKEGYVPCGLAMRERYDVGATYDGRIIVSARTVSVLNRFGLDASEYVPVTATKDFFFVAPKTVLAIDEHASGVRHEGSCSRCGTSVATVFEDLVLADKIGPISKGIYRSNIAFGAGKSKCFVLLVGTDTRTAILSERLSGVIMLPVLAQRSKPALRYNS